MKRTFLVILASALVVSCCKQPACPPVQPPVSPKLEGCWFGANSTSICFTDSLLSKDTEPFYPYAASTDSVYYLLDDGSRFAQYGYTLVNDTLRLYPVLRHPDAPFVYWN